MGNTEAVSIGDADFGGRVQCWRRRPSGRRRSPRPRLVVAAIRSEAAGAAERI